MWDGLINRAPILMTGFGIYVMWDGLINLRKYSLIRRNPDGITFSLHRLVQAVLRDAMDEQMQQEWSERIARIINEAFSSVEFSVWKDCQRYLPHAQYCFDLVKQWNMIFPEAARLLNEAGHESFPPIENCGVWNRAP